MFPEMRLHISTRVTSDVLDVVYKGRLTDGQEQCL